MLFLRVPGKRQRQNPHLLFISPGGGEDRGGPVRLPFVQRSGRASSPAGREMSCRDVIVGHSASREWTTEVQLRFSFSFLAPSPRSPLWPDSERPESSTLDAGGDAGSPAPWAGPCAGMQARHKGWAGVGLPSEACRVPLLCLVCSGHRRESSCFHGSTPLGFGGSAERL